MGLQLQNKSMHVVTIHNKSNQQYSMIHKWTAKHYSFITNDHLQFLILINFNHKTLKYIKDLLAHNMHIYDDEKLLSHVFDSIGRRFHNLHHSLSNLLPHHCRDLRHLFRKHTSLVRTHLPTSNVGVTCCEWEWERESILICSVFGGVLLKHDNLVLLFIGLESCDFVPNLIK